MAFGIYVHIPYCLQRCHYCDFTTFATSEIRPSSEYLELLLREIKARAHLFPAAQLTSLYFGGGTPSILPAENIVTIIAALANAGFPIHADTEVTIEINPATMNEASFRIYRDGGVNRFSVGAQTFDDDLLARCGRKHTALQTRQTLDFLAGQNVNYSFDLLFALPGQTFVQLESDLELVAKYNPPHLSAYCLTVPANHPMSAGRPADPDQLRMFDLIEERLQESKLIRYEISNFSRPGWESKHNLLYWTDQPYWGIGLSAHSYQPDEAYGVRFWNSNSMQEYERQATASDVPHKQRERLRAHEALTDYCHTSLRRSAGVDLSAMGLRFGEEIASLVRGRLLSLQAAGLVESAGGGWRLTRQGVHLSNQAFLEVTFSAQELARLPSSPNLLTR
ncbi:MAG: radical SAM family heme chaperone HemW [Bdellovibrionales bacterium]|nr:radical SAM family heme chaperone HemW [Bdellovibrionales bacterium]